MRTTAPALPRSPADLFPGEQQLHLLSGRLQVDGGVSAGGGLVRQQDGAPVEAAEGRRRQAGRHAGAGELLPPAPLAAQVLQAETGEQSDNQPIAHGNCHTTSPQPRATVDKQPTSQGNSQTGGPQSRVTPEQPAYSPG